jgi:hypothetical protein
MPATSTRTNGYDSDKTVPINQTAVAQKHVFVGGLNHQILAREIKGL